MDWELHHSEFSAQLYLGLAVVILESPGLITPTAFLPVEETRLALKYFSDVSSPCTLIN